MDFPYQGIRIEHEDGSVFNLRFALVRERGPWTVVFTEHNGWILLATDDLKSVHTYRRAPRRNR